ncbi:hypothetical protein BHE74_00002707, partial [Ensete ventricosum]
HVQTIAHRAHRSTCKRPKIDRFWSPERVASGGQRTKQHAPPSLLYENPIQSCAIREILSRDNVIYSSIQ